jgi:hypothetical protein
MRTAPSVDDADRVLEVAQIWQIRPIDTVCAASSTPASGSGSEIAGWPKRPVDAVIGAGWGG